MSGNSAVGVSHGKAILFGEHAVVHGHPAVAAGLDRGVVVEALADLHGPVMEVDPWGLEARPGGRRKVDLALRSFLEDHDLLHARVRLRATSDVPLGAGLGSSAALFVAAASALAAYFGEELELGALERWAGCAETVFHGNPSGIDVAATARGGVGWFVRGEGWSPVVLPGPLHLAIGREAGRRDTAASVRKVNQRLREEPELVAEIFAKIAELTAAARPALRSGDWRRVGRLMTANHELLRELGVSTPGLNALCDSALAEGALGAKMTGAGGGGSVIALIRAGDRRVSAAWRELGRDAFNTEIRPG